MTVRAPRGLRRDGAALWRETVEAIDLNVLERDALRRACELADLAADLKADIAERGLVIGDRPNPSVLRLVQVQTAITRITKALVPKEPSTRHLSRSQRNKLRDLQARGYG